MKFVVTAVTVLGVIALMMGCIGYGLPGTPSGTPAEPAPATGAEAPVAGGQAVNQPQDAGSGVGEPSPPGGSGGSGAGAEDGSSGGSPPGSPPVTSPPQPPAVPPPEETPVPGAPPPAETPPPAVPPPVSQPAGTSPEETPPPTQPQEAAERSCNDPIPEWLCGTWEWGGTTPAIKWTFAGDEIFGAVNGAGVKGSVSSTGTVRAGLLGAGQPYVLILVTDAEGEGEFYRFNREPNPDHVSIYIYWMSASYRLHRVIP